MKKKYLFGSIATVAAVAAFTMSCDQQQATVSSIELTGAKASFTVGDTFSSEGLAVTAKMSDGTTSTIEAANFTIDSSKVNLSAPGSYVVMVTYNGVTAYYTVTVVAKDNVQTFVSATVNTSSAKLDYEVGEAYSAANLGLVVTYSNSSITENTVEYVSSLTGYTTTIKNAAGETVETLASSGVYTVTLTKDSITASYNIYVGTTVRRAVDLGAQNASKIGTGEVTTYEQSYSYRTGLISSSKSVNEFAFGENYLTLKETEGIYNGRVEHFENYNGTKNAIRVNASGEASINNDVSVTSEADKIIKGYRFNLLGSTDYSSTTYYGTEELIFGLYSEGLRNENQDFEESVTTVVTGDSKYDVYEFSFGKYLSAEEVGDYYAGFSVINVRFTLNADNSFGTATVSESKYTNDETIEKKDHKDEEGTVYYTYAVKEEYTENGSKYKTVANNIHKFEIVQTSGERDAENPYSGDSIFYQSYNLAVKDKVDDEFVDAENATFTENDYNDGTITFKANSSLVYLQVTDLVGSENANFALDKPKFSSPQVNDGTETTSIYDFNTGLNVGKDYSTDSFTISCSNYGTFELTIKTGCVSHTYTLNVTYADVTSISGRVFNNSLNEDEKSFSNTSNAITVDRDAEVYLNGKTNQASDPAYTAELLDTTDATLEETNIMFEGVSYKMYKFKATALGSYRVKYTSTANPDVSSTMTITIADPFIAADTITNANWFGKFVNGEDYYTVTPSGIIGANGEAIEVKSLTETSATVVLRGTTTETTMTFSSDNSTFTLNGATYTKEVTEADQAAYASLPGDYLTSDGLLINLTADATNPSKGTVKFKGGSFYNDETFSYYYIAGKIYLDDLSASFNSCQLEVGEGSLIVSYTYNTYTTLVGAVAESVVLSDEVKPEWIGTYSYSTPYGQQTLTVSKTSISDSYGYAESIDYIIGNTVYAGGSEYIFSEDGNSFEFWGDTYVKESSGSEETPMITNRDLYGIYAASNGDFIYVDANDIYFGIDNTATAFGVTEVIGTNYYNAIRESISIVPPGRGDATVTYNGKNYYKEFYTTYEGEDATGTQVKMQIFYTTFTLEEGVFLFTITNPRGQTNTAAYTFIESDSGITATAVSTDYPSLEISCDASYNYTVTISTEGYSIVENLYLTAKY